MAALPANPPTELWIWDTDIRGLFVRVYPTGLKTFALKYRHDGRQRIFTIGKYGSPWTVDAARAKANELLREAAMGADPQAAKIEKRQALTVDELIELYLREGPKDKPNKRRRSWDNDRLHLKRHVAPLIGAMKAHAVRSSDVARVQADVALGKTAAFEKTKKRGVARVKGGYRAAAVTVVCLQAMYNWAIKRELLGANPARGVERYRSEGCERFLSDAELKRLLETMAELVLAGKLSSNLAAAFRLLLLTGARKSEISDLRWEEIDFERGFINLSADRSKTGKKRIPLCAAALHELDALPRAKTGYVFPARRGEGPTRAMQDAWETIRAAADLEGVRIHDLRHTFASLAAAEGQSLFLIGKALGHSQARTTERYAHLSADPLRAVGDHVSRRLELARAHGANDAGRPDESPRGDSMIGA